MRSCLNCNTPFEQSQKYCDKCGQKTAFDRLTLLSIIQDFLSNLFNVESKLFLTIRHLFVPAKLAKSYIAGKRATYYNPLRMFLIVLALFFTAIFFAMNETIEQSKEITDKIETSVSNSLIVEKLDSFAIANNLTEQQSYDLRCEIIPNTLSINDTIFIDEGIFQLSASNSGFNTVEFFTLPIEDLFEKYEVEDALTQITLKQAKQFVDNPRESIRYIISNSTWVIASTILLFALFFMLIYRNYLYAEHVIFHIIGHSRFLLITTLLIFINAQTLNLSSGQLLLIITVIAAIYFYLDLKVLYRQSRVLTFFKFLPIIICLSLSFTCCFLCRICHILLFSLGGCKLL